MVLATLVLCVFLAVFILQSANDLFGLNQQDKQVEVVIPQNPTVSQVTDILTETGVVEKSLTFRLYAGMKTKEKSFKPGNYIFNYNMGYDEIILALKNGNIKKEIVTPTFIEGMTLYEIARKLEENRVCDADEFLDYLQTAELNYEFIDQLPDSGLRYRRLEGYIFPDTYEFYVGEKVSNVAAKFLDNFESRITEDMRRKAQNLNLTLDQVITLASIIQKEAGDPEEMRLVSSVFHNRLNLPENYPNLQSDVTIHYVEKFIKPFLDYANQDMYNAYNTYIAPGLPVGPICNPGLDAIEAALEPDNTRFLFFVTDSEGSYYYAETAKDHYANVSAARQVGAGKIHGTDTEE